MKSSILKNFFKSLRFRLGLSLLPEISSKLDEMIWSSVYHDSIRGRKHLEELSLNVGRWAGGYAFFYVLNRLLSDYQPKKILEFGLGESTKFVSIFVENYLSDCQHVVVEHDFLWMKNFQNKFRLGINSSVLDCVLEKRVINGYEGIGYGSIKSKVQGKFDLYIVDGPFGSERFSRYDIHTLLDDRLETTDEMVIVVDDAQRVGEQDTVTALVRLFESRKIKVYLGMYSGDKCTAVIATTKYRYAATF